MTLGSPKVWLHCAKTITGRGEPDSQHEPLVRVSLMIVLPLNVTVSHTSPEQLRIVTALADDAGAACDGASAWALPHLRELCAEEPLNEQAHAWLMTVLAATGQQAAALQVFAAVRRRLKVELGIGPSLVLARARTAVLGGRLGAGDVCRGRVVARVRAVESDFDRSSGGDRSVVGGVGHGDRGA